MKKRVENAKTLTQLLAPVDPKASLAQRNLQLIALLDWVRGDRQSVEAATARVAELVSLAEQSPVLRERLQRWWQAIMQSVDITMLLADFGFAQRTSMLSELAERLRHKVLPNNPDTIDASELFMAALYSEFDALWLNALDEDLINRLSQVFTPEQGSGEASTHWHHALADAITYCAGNILATGFAPELRLRMTKEMRDAQPFHALVSDAESLRVEVLHPLRTSNRLDATVARLRDRLDACRNAANTVYTHFEDNGISVGLVFRLRQLRARIVRVRELLECLLSPKPAVAAVRLMARLVSVSRERRSLKALFMANSSLLAAKVAERNAETGSHYITRTPSEYFSMVKKAAGGGLVMAFTTLIKFGLYSFAFSAFWGGFWAGVNYAASFVLVQLFHFTVATKQPAMTAPAMAAKLKNIEDEGSEQAFVDEVTHLVRSQVAAILGNVLIVFPAVLGITLLLAKLLGHSAISEHEARHVIDTLKPWGGSLLFAAFTGVLLFASSIFAGWVENWFVLNRLDAAIHYNPRITRAIGAARATRIALFLRNNLSGLAANISLGFMLGLVPVIAAFFGLGLDVRHVTLSTGQMAAAASALGPEVMHMAAFWWSMATLLFIGALNVLVSFYLAFRLALIAQNVTGVERSRIARALRQRIFHSPLSFFAPSRANV
ncbi:site-specific recombinase [Diaphorobacter aerolatus]|uniref:Site-specific recombinase n=1 Tax=Diaphorobacter aerolatus TaxID=1288495 RepID=A0A7H0GPP2_9BURK|nr:site-specific recombinase [Diaphorobacter aerolatus]QNP50258.1 site-specific recombinase [Diaphorobacter aerolatus]